MPDDPETTSPGSETPVDENLARVLRAGTLRHEEWLAAGRVQVDLLCKAIGRKDLAGVDLLDVGCGTLLVRTLQDNALPIGHYAGVDVEPELIEWLHANAADPRFEFHVLDAHNAMYNPDGKPLASFDLLPVGPRRFDLICLFSVFTHLAPGDYVAMLRLLRRHAKPGGKLLFTLFLIDPEEPSPYEQAGRKQLQSEDSEARAQALANAAKAAEARRRVTAEHDPRFVDEDPDDPLRRARYTEDYALELFEGTGWEVESINPPHPKGYVQHYMVCRPI